MDNDEYDSVSTATEHRNCDISENIKTFNNPSTQPKKEVSKFMTSYIVRLQLLTGLLRATK